MNRNKKVKLYAILTIVLWASAFPFTKIALQHYSPNALGSLRITTAAVFLFIIGRGKKIPLPNIRDWYKFFIAGALGFALYMFTFNVGIQTLNSATSSIIMATSPVAAAIGAAIFYRERIGIRGLTAFVVELAGIAILTLWEGSISINTGIFWLLLTSLLFGGYNLYQRKLLFQGYAPLEITIYSMAAGAFLLSPFLFAGICEMQSASLIQTITVIYLGIGPNAIAAFLWGVALSIAKKTSDVTNFMFVTPLLAALMGLLMLGEYPSAGTCVGGIMILGGLIIFQNKVPISEEQ